MTVDRISAPLNTNPHTPPVTVSMYTSLSSWPKHQFISASLMRVLSTVMSDTKPPRRLEQAS